MNMSCIFFGGFSLWILLICPPTAGGLEAICLADSGLEQCGVPPLSPAQIASIDRARVNAIRYEIGNRTARRPIIENDPEVSSTALIQPIINFTDAQRDALRSLYRNNMQPPSTNGTTTVNFRTRRQTNRLEACEGNTIARILFAVTPNSDVVQIEGVFPTSIGCSKTSVRMNACQGECCEVELAVPIFIYNIDTMNWGRDDVIVTRCTCCEMPTVT